MKNIIRWDNLTWTEIRELAEKDTVVLIPVGSTEQHGPHLPVGCDSIIATHISELACRKLNDSGVSAVVATDNDSLQLHASHEFPRLNVTLAHMLHAGA